MSAQVIIKKYTGKDSDFGTVVSSLGIKRVDTCVPSVYSSEKLGGKTVPADDGSESQFYCIYRPDEPDCKAYSMECVFKLHLIKAPDTQLTNIRIYPVGKRPPSEHAAKLMIGNSISYSQPTNSKSMVAVHDIWDYSKEHPFYLTVSGLYGQVPNPSMSKMEYSVEYKDFGYGNLVCLDGARQIAVPVSIRTDAGNLTLKFKDRTFMAKSDIKRDVLEFVDPRTGLPIPHTYYRTITPAASGTDILSDGPVLELYVKTDEWNLMDLYPDGLIYKIPADTECDYVGTGYMIYWINTFAAEAGWQPIDDVTRETTTGYVPNRWFKSIYDATDATITENPEERPFDKPVEYYDVEVKCDEHGHPVYYINGSARPQLIFDVHKTYHFFNRSGGHFPMRFIGHMHSHMANNIDDIITDGIVVLHGNSDEEEIFVNPEKVLKSGHCINAYQCVCKPALGNVVYNRPLDMCGHYNMCRVGGGVYNPRMAGETDYVYLQLEVDGQTDPGYCIPDLEIYYDEY